MKSKKDFRLIFQCTAVACIIASINMSCTSSPPSELSDEMVIKAFQLKYAFSLANVKDLTIIEKKVQGDTATVKIRCKFMPDCRLAEKYGESSVVQMTFKRSYTGWN